MYQVMVHFWTARAFYFVSQFILLRNRKKTLKFFKHKVLPYMVTFLKDGLDLSFTLYLILNFGATILVKNIFFFLKTFVSLI